MSDRLRIPPHANGGQARSNLSPALRGGDQLTGLEMQSAQRRRPMGVTLVAIVQAVNAAIAGAEMLAGHRGVPETDEWAAVTLGVATAAIGFSVAWGLWQVRHWAWTATMLWVGVTLTAGLIAYFRGQPSYIVMALCVLQVFYLNQSDVQHVFGRGGRREGDEL